MAGIVERHFLSDLICEEFGVSASDPWPDDAAVYQPNDSEQSLLYEYAECLSLQTFLTMCDLPFRIEVRPNAEYMSPNGIVPFLQAGKVVIAGFQPIVDFVARKGAQLPYSLTEAEMADMQALQCLVQNVLLNAEKYICWAHEPTLHSVTLPRFSAPYTWPLNHIVPFLRRYQMRNQLKTLGWMGKSVETVIKDVNDCCKTLSLKLGGQEYFCTDQPTELDALVFGHLYTLLTTELPDVDVASTVKQYQNLVDFCKRVEKRYYSHKGNP